MNIGHQLVQRQRPLIVATLLACALMSEAFAVSVRVGDILVADPDFHSAFTDGGYDNEARKPTVWKVDPTTGAREVITSEDLGGGAPLYAPSAAVMDRAGRLTVADGYGHTLLRVDPTTGNRSYFSGEGNTGSGVNFQALTDMIVDRDNSLVVVDHLSNMVFRVDAETGHRTEIAGPSRGQGPDLTYMTTIALGPTGDLWTLINTQTDNGAALVRIDPVSGDRQIVSGFGDMVDSLSAEDIFFLNDRTALASGVQIYQVDLITGHRTAIASSGPQLQWPGPIVRTHDGALVLADEYTGALYRLDLESREHKLFSGNTSEWGRRIGMPLQMFVVAPEPTGGLLMTAAQLMVRRTRVSVQSARWPN
jgi:sugar lactone lactonase YvrE